MCHHPPPWSISVEALTDMREYNRTAERVQQSDVPTIQQIHLNSGGTAIVVIAMFLFSVIILYVTSQNADSAPYGIVGSVCFFLFGTPIGLLAVNGGLAQMWGDWQRERTIRKRDEQQTGLQAAYYVQGGVEVVRPPQLPYELPVDRPQLPQGPNFVPAQPPADVRIKMACINFVTGLFDDEGRPNPKLILPDTAKRPGQVQAKKPGPAPLEYLLSLGIVSVGDGGMLFFNTDRYPTLHDALLAIKRGTLAGTEAPRAKPSPHALPPYTRVGEVAA